MRPADFEGSRPASATPAHGLPPGTGNAFGFAAFNALSFQMILGSPMVLYASSLGASSTILGLIAGMLPLMVVLQIPAARFVDRVGYKKYVVRGWSIRTLFVALLAVIPLLPDAVSQEVRLGAVMVLLFCFNAVRGVFSCGWLPWITSLIPGEVRGRYLTREAAVTNMASVIAFLLAATALGASTGSGRFSLLFLLSTLFAIASIVFLSRIPQEPDTSSNAVVPRPRLPQMFGNSAFRKLLIMNVFWSISTGGILTFLVVFFKDRLHLPESTILLLISLTFMGGILNQLLLRTALDRYGSKPVMTVGLILWIGVMAAWTSLAGGVVSASMAMIAVLILALGLASSLVNLANIRLAMLVIPEQGRSHYFAVYSVVGSVILGLSPVCWGVLIDACSGIEAVLGGILINRYTILFASFTFMLLLTLVSAWFLEERDAGRLDDMMRALLGKSRVRYWLRFWFRSTPRP